MIFTVPIRTVSALNAREHWAKKARRVKAERQATYYAASMHPLRYLRAKRAKMGTEAGQQHTVTLTRIAPRQLDDDNLRGALKGVRDEVAEMLGVDDRDPVVRWEYGQRKGKAKEWAVEVRIEEARQTRHEARHGTQGDGKGIGRGE